MIESLALYAFATLVLAGGLAAALMRQILYAIIGLALSLFGLAGFFLYLGSPFVAAMQVMIYIGGISVAIVFAMMLSVPMALSPPAPQPFKLVLALLGGIGFFAAVAWILPRAQFPLQQAPAPEAWAVGNLGHALLNDYNLVFETLSLVLLLAIIGAVLVAKRESAV